MRLVLAATALLLSTDAFAGGVGLMFTGGMRTDRVYFYDSAQNMKQFQQVQLSSNYGGGLEFLLGDRDDRINGMFRGYWLRDAAQKNPASITDDNGVRHIEIVGTEDVDPEDVVAAVRDTPHDVGTAAFGVQWGLVGNPSKSQLVLITALGAGFITRDHTEFLMGNVGVGGTFTIAHDFQISTTIEYSVRYRKSFSMGANAVLGVRYLFD